MQGVEQERNMLRNKAKKLEGKVLETDDLDSIKEAYAELAKEKADREEAEHLADERKQAEEFRDKIISEYPDAVQKAAKRLIEKNKNNLIWENAASWDDARSQLAPQLDALKEVISPNGDEDTTEIHANNVSNRQETKKFEDLSVEEMRKLLPRAAAR